MSQTSFSIAYDGPAVESGAMDVRDLAPALLAVGQLFDAANAVLNGQRATVGVNVQATTQGSFEVVLDVVQSMGSQLVSVFSGDAVTAALQLKELVIWGGSAGVGGGVIWLVKKLRGERPQKVEKIDEDSVRIIHRGETIIVPLKLLRLYDDLIVRDALDRLIREPLDGRFWQLAAQLGFHQASEEARADGQGIVVEIVAGIVDWAHVFAVAVADE